jgi:superfamily II DNA or RNA helicase
MPEAQPGTEIELRFVGGTLELRGLRPEPAASAAVLPGACSWDARTSCHRAPARAYAEIVRACRQQGLVLRDAARAYGTLSSGLQVQKALRPFQSEALDAWRGAGRRGLVVLPTGAGKSHVALLAIDATRRHTLVVAPTLDLVRQWYDLLRTSFLEPVGIVGGGDHRIEPITVTTYDSAYLHMEHFGARFGLVVFDECHHLPGESYALAAQFSLAPYRLGLTATPERADGRERLFPELVGEIVYRRDIAELSGEYLADYRVEQIRVALTESERTAYEEARAVYRDFVRSQGIRMSSPRGWSEFILRSSISAEGRRAMKAYQLQKSIAFSAPSKLRYVEHLLQAHCRDRVLVFTERNQYAYELARRFLIPVITQQTKVSERSAILEDFSSGVYNAIASSKVLNEGVDIPAANVGIVLSGSGSVREHVQRLGRILRKQADKRAVLYEIVSDDTAELQTSARRREHVAYD